MGNIFGNNYDYKLQRQDGVTEFAYDDWDVDLELGLEKTFEKCHGPDKCKNEVEFFPGNLGVGRYCKKCRYRNMDKEWFN